MDTLVALATGFAALNVAILVGLIYFYGRMAFKTRAGYTFGLMIFSGLLLAQNAVMVYVCAFLTGLYSWQLYPFFDALAVMEFVGLLALFRVTM